MKLGRTHTAVGIFIILVGGLTSGCASESETANEAASDSNDVIDGEKTFDRPEVGMLVFARGNMCTGTLIAPNAVLTASHCVEHKSHEELGRSLGTFEVELKDGNAEKYDVDGWVAYGKGVGDDDIAVLHLQQKVPGNIATPARIADKKPEKDALVTAYGYGCEKRGARGLFWKRKASFKQGRYMQGCSGDSGGPTFIGDDESGPVFEVMSGSNKFAPVLAPLGRGGDIFGDAVKWRAQVMKQASAWR